MRSIVYFFAKAQEAIASNLEDTITSGNIISDLTDHFSQFCILNSSNDLFDLQSKKMLLRDF